LPARPLILTLAFAKPRAKDRGNPERATGLGCPKGDGIVEYYKYLIPFLEYD